MLTFFSLRRWPWAGAGRALAAGLRAKRRLFLHVWPACWRGVAACMAWAWQGTPPFVFCGSWFHARRASLLACLLSRHGDARGAAMLVRESSTAPPYCPLAVTARPCVFLRVKFLQGQWPQDIVVQAAMKNE